MAECVVESRREAPGRENGVACREASCAPGEVARAVQCLSSILEALVRSPALHKLGQTGSLHPHPEAAPATPNDMSPKHRVWENDSRKQMMGIRLRTVYQNLTREPPGWLCG